MAKLCWVILDFAIAWLFKISDDGVCVDQCTDSEECQSPYSVQSTNSKSASVC